MKYALFTCLLVIDLVIGAGVAQADIPPPDDYVETCTVEKQAPGLTCESCRAWHGDVNACDKTLGAQGFRKMCKSWGASSWSEVWCKGEATGPVPAEGPTPTNGSESKQTGCAGGGIELWALAGLALALLRRRALTTRLTR